MNILPFYIINCLELTRVVVQDTLVYEKTNSNIYSMLTTKPVYGAARMQSCKWPHYRAGPNPERTGN